MPDDGVADRRLHEEVRKLQLSLQEAGKSREQHEQTMHQMALRERALGRANLTLKLIGDIRRLLLEGVDEDAWLQEICTRITRESCYGIAWIGMAEADGTIKSVACSGCDGALLDAAHFRYDGGKQGATPAFRAIGSGKPEVVNDVRTVTGSLAWGRQIEKLGYLSLIALPLHVGGKVAGVLTIVGDKSEEFDEHTIKLLRSFAGDVAFGITYLHTKSQREEAEQRLARQQMELERERAVAQMRAHQFKEVLDTLEQGIFLKDTESNYMSCNRRHAEFIGLDSPEAIAGKRDEQLYPSDLALKYQHDDRRVIESGEAIDMEESGIIGGHRVTVQTVKVPMRDARGNITGILGIYWDISERKRIEDTLRRNEALLNDAEEMAHIGGWEFDVATGDGTWTDEVARIHDLDPNDPTSRDIGLSYYHGESREQIEKAVNEAVEQGRPYDLELQIISAKGTRKWIRTIGHPVTDGGRTIRVRGTFQDISDRKKAESLMQQRLDELERFQKATVGREFRIKELKAEIARLLRQLGEGS